MSGASFLISLEQKISGPAKTAASALAELEARILGETKALAALEAWQKRLQKSGAVDIAEYRKVNGLIEQKQKSLAGLTEKFVGMKAGTEEAAGETDFLTGKLAAMGGAAGAAMAAVVAVGLAIGAVILKGALLALTLSGARQAFLTTTAAMLGSDGAAAALNEQIESLRKKVPLSRAELEGLGTSLANIGLKGDALAQTFEALALVQSVRGVEAANKLKTVLEDSFAEGVFKIDPGKLAGTGISIQDFYAELSKRIGVGNDQIEGLLKAGKISVEDGVAALNAAATAKLGAAAEKLANGPGAVWQKFKDDLAELFTGVDIGPFMAAMKDLLSIFDSNSESGKMLKQVVTEMFSGLFNWLAKIAPYGKALFEGMLEGANALYRLLAPIGSWLMALFGIDGTPTEESLETIRMIGKGIIIVLAVIVGLLAIAVIAVLLLLAPFIILGVIIVWLIGLVVDFFDWLTSGAEDSADAVEGATSSIGDSFSGVFDGITGMFSNFSLADMGSNMMAGLAEGIFGGGGAVSDAIQSVIKNAISSATSTLKISSPSQVFAEMGGYTAEGFAQGVDAGTADVQGSVQSMLAVPNAEAGKAGAGGAGGATLTIAEGAIVIQVNGGKPDEVRRSVALGLGDAFEQLGLHAGF